MSQIASKVRYRPSNTLLSRRPAMPWSTHWSPCCSLARCHCQCCSIAHAGPPEQEHVQIARNADRFIAIEPLRAPGYASPIANAPRRKLAELLEAAKAGHYGKRTLALTLHSQRQRPGARP